MKRSAPAFVVQQAAGGARHWWRVGARALNGVLTIAYFDRLVAISREKHMRGEWSAVAEESGGSYKRELDESKDGMPAGGRRSLSPEFDAG